jgi:DinB superfamily
MPEDSIVRDNAAVTARLEALVSRLSDTDLQHDLGGGWTVSVALAHLAFWDRRIAYVLGRWSAGGEPHVELDDDVVNKALEELLKVVEPRDAARLAVESAEAADAAIARVPEEIASQLIAEDHAYLLRRSGHRGEHIEQIEAALGA